MQMPKIFSPPRMETNSTFTLSKATDTAGLKQCFHPCQRAEKIFYRHLHEGQVRGTQRVDRSGQSLPLCFSQRQSVKCGNCLTKIMNSENFLTDSCFSRKMPFTLQYKALL